MLSSNEALQKAAQSPLWTPTSFIREYLKILAVYRQRAWGCKNSNNAGLSFEEALASETRSQKMLDQFPDCYEEVVARLVNHATLKQEDLSQRIVAYFKDHYVVGEEVFAVRDGREAALRISACLDTADQCHDSHMLSTEVILPPDLEDTFQIEWLSDYTRTIVKRKDLIRKQLPLTRMTVKAWLQSSTEIESIHGIKGITCIWHVNESLRKRYALDEDIPALLRERLDRAQERKEKAKRPAKAEMDSTMFLDDFIMSPEAAEDGQDGSPNYIPGPGSRKARTSVSRTVNSSAEAPGKVTVPVETASQVKARQPAGTLKRVIFDALEAAGDQGMSTAELAELVQASGVKTWEAVKSAQSSINATCSHDLAFKRTGPGRFVLRMLVDKTMQVATASSARGTDNDDSAAQPQAQIERNNFKCSKCLKAHHADNSPLILCDSCPRSYHLACLDLSFEELPEEDWHCPKCQDRKSSTGRRITSNLHRADIYERFDSDREDGSLGALSPGDRHLASNDRLKEDGKASREQARIAAKFAALYPIDDLETLEDEEDKLATREAEALAIAEEADRAAKKPNPKNDQRHADRIARLQRKAEAARKRAAALRLVIEGPLPATHVTSSSASTVALYDALAVVDFVTIFGASFEAPAMGLLDVQQMVAHPLDGPHLAQINMALLRCLMLEAMSMEGVVKSRAKRWANCLDEHTWPEVLRRYLQASRVGMTLPESLANADASVDTAVLDDNSACILGARLLARMPFYKLGCGLQLRILAALCNDVADCTHLRNEMNARIDEMNKLQAEFRQRQFEDKRRLKIEAARPVVAPTTDANPGPQEVEEAKPADQPVAEQTPVTDVKQEEQGEHTSEGRRAGSPVKQENNSDQELSTESEGEDVNKDAGQSIPDGTAGKATTLPALEAPLAIEGAAEEGMPSKNADLHADGPQRKANGVPQEPTVQAPELSAELTGIPAEESQKLDTGTTPAGNTALPGEQVPTAGLEKKIAVAPEHPGPPQSVPQEESDMPKPNQEAHPTETKAIVEPFPKAQVQKGKRKARRKGDMQKKKAEALLAAQERQFEDEMRERETALDDALDARAIRGEPLGLDRNHRAYWWFPGEPAVVFVEEADGKGLGMLENPEDLLNLMDRLNQNGLREKALYQTLQKRYESISSSLGHRMVHLDVQTAPRLLPDNDLEEQVCQHTKGAVEISVKKLETFLDQFERIPASPATKSVSEWKSQVSTAGDSRSLVTIALELEADINGLGTGLPSGADDASLAGYAKRRKAAAVPQQPVTDPFSRNTSIEPTVGGSSSRELSARLAQNEAAQPDGLGLSHPQGVQQMPKAEGHLPNGHATPMNGALQTAAADSKPLSGTQESADIPSNELRIKTETAMGDADNASVDTPTTADDSGTAKLGDVAGSDVHATNGSSAVLQEDRVWVPMPPAEYVEQLFANEGFHPAGDVILPPDELDASDTEASKNKRGGMVWRSARERRVWLKDAKFALDSGDSSRAAYVVAALVDRSQQLLRSLERASKRAAAALNALNGDDIGISDDEERTEDEAPAPRREATPKPVLNAAEEDRGVKSLRAAAKQQPAKEVLPRKASRKSKAASEATVKAEGRGSQTPQPAKRPRTAAKGKAGQDREEAAKLIQDVMAIANGGVAPPGQTWIPTEEGRWSANCQVCGETGDLLCCDAPDCTVAQHIACAGLDEPPANDIWFCEKHRHKPSLKRSRNAAKRDGSQPAPAKRSGGKSAQGAPVDLQDQSRKPAAKKRKT